jgi:alpha-galactosidase
MKSQAAFALGVLSAPLAARGYNNGLALTPQMGWNSWNYFACDISEDTILSAAQSLVSQNLTKFGYECTCIKF